MIEDWVFRPWVTSGGAGEIKTVSGETIAQTVQRGHAEEIVTAHNASLEADRILSHMKERHKELAAGKLWNGPHGACAACMLPDPCKVAQAIRDAEEAATR